MLRNMFVTIAAVAVLGLAVVSFGAMDTAPTDKAADSRKTSATGAGSDCCMKGAQDVQRCCCCCCDCEGCSGQGNCCKGHAGKKSGKGHGGAMGGCAKKGMKNKDCPAASE